jgi:hypothetical protein
MSFVMLVCLVLLAAVVIGLVPGDARLKQVAVVLVILGVVMWILVHLGILHGSLR